MIIKELVSQLRAQLAAQFQQINLLKETLFPLRSQLQSKLRKKDKSYSSLLSSSVLVSKTINLGVRYGRSLDSLIYFSKGSLEFCYDAILPKSSNYNLGLNTFRE